ncbi:MAG: hypothetical protein IJ202_06645 [Bacteroidales bacterium]|nr:hypothetical protein [Bacteroidales bacterium]
MKFVYESALLAEISGYLLCGPLLLREQPFHVTHHDLTLLAVHDPLIFSFFYKTEGRA